LLTLVFTGVEVAGSVAAGSIALLSDAAHLVTDVLGLVASIWAISIANREQNARFSFGYHRAEIMGTIISLFTIWAMTAYLLDQAITRLLQPGEHKVIGKIMFIIACCGVVFNVIQISILHSGDLDSL
jgi:solute carrier family 30 (zinc transporter), member 2